MCTDTDGIVYLLWPRLDFQCLTCCNPHSVHGARRVAQTSHCCFPRTALLLLPSLPPRHTRCVRRSEVSTAGRRSRSRPRLLSNSLGTPPPTTPTLHQHTHTHRQTTHQEGSSRLIGTTDFVILNLSHRHFARIQTHGIHFKPRLCCR